MKITLLHGDNLELSRKRFGVIVNAIKKRGWNVNILSKDKLDLAVDLASHSLFDTNDDLFVIDNFFKDVAQNQLEWLEKNSQTFSCNLLIYQEGLLPAKLIKYLGKNAKVEKFDLPKLIFSFLDAIFPGNSTYLIGLLHKLVQTEPIELVFTLLCSLMRDLIWIKLDEKSLDYPAWRKSKLKRQADKFSEQKLKTIIDKLSQIDTKVKSSEASLLQSLDLLIVTELQ